MSTAWRDAMRPIKCGPLDARAAGAWIIWFAIPTIWTVLALAVTTIVFWVLQHFGLSVEVALRRFRCWVIGDWRPPTVTAAQRRLSDG